MASSPLIGVENLDLGNRAHLSTADLPHLQVSTSVLPDQMPPSGVADVVHR